MALAKERHNPNDLVHQAFTFFDNVIGHDFEEDDSSDKSGGGGINKNFAISRSSSTLSSPNSMNSSAFMYRPSNNYHQPEEGHSVISFKPGYDNFMQPSSSCFLRFEQNDEQPYLGLDPSGQLNSGSISNVRLLENFNSIQTSSGNMYGSLTNPSSSSIQENHHGEMELYGWANPQDHPDHRIEDLATQEFDLHKRPHTGESMQANKKQCTSATKKAKPKSNQTQSSKDPQSIAAKNRRERISERLKVLQDLVPNGSKVDLVTMLEKAISYVKFLQLQVKVLATDEFWPVQGGKAPELSQVKEAIDAIISSSQRDRNSSSSVK